VTAKKRACEASQEFLQMSTTWRGL